MPIATSYARFSSDMQKESSIEDQLRICEQQIKQQGWERTAPYSDYAISGASLERPGLKTLMNDAAKNQFEIVVVEGLDRLSRDSEHMPGLYKRLTFNGVRIYSLTDGGFVSDIHIAFGGAKNALFLKDLAFKVKRGMTGRVEGGKAIGKRIYGYDIVRRFDARGEPVRGERSINDTEAQIVRRIFESYASGQSARKIATQLNAEGIPSPNGKKWSPASINGWKKEGSGILNSEWYIGRMVWNRHSCHKDPDTEKIKKRRNVPSEWVTGDVPHLRIIEQSLWESVKKRQESLATKGYSHMKRRPKYLLSYLLKCGQCGGGYSQLSQNYYGCTNTRQNGTCNNRKAIAKDKLERAVLKAVEHQLLAPELIDAFTEEYKAHLHHLQNTRQDNEAKLKKQLTKLDNEKARLVEAIKAGIPASELKEEFNVNAQQRTELLSRFKHITEQVASAPESNITDKFKMAISTLKTQINTTDNDALIETIRTLIDKVVMTPDPKTGKLGVKLYGDLAGLLASDVDTVQGAINEPYLTPSANQQESNGMGRHGCFTSIQFNAV